MKRTENFENKNSYIVTVLKPSQIIVDYIDTVRDKLISKGYDDFLGQDAIGAHCTLTVHSLSCDHYQAFLNIIDGHVHNIGKKQSQLLGISSFVGSKAARSNVLYANMLIKADLLGCQKSLYKILSQFDAHIYSDYVRVDQWVPHMTIHPNLTDEQLPQAIEAALSVWHDMNLEGNHPFTYEELEIFSFDKDDQNKVTLKETSSWDLV